MITPIKETSLLDISNGVVLELQVLKKHAGHVAIIVVAPNGDYKSLMANEWSLNSQIMIDQNKKGENLKPLPIDWPVDHGTYKEPVRSPEDLARDK